MEYPVVKNHFKVPNEAPKVEIPIRSVSVDSKYEIVGEFTSNTAKDQYDILQERSEDNLSKTENNLDLKSSHSEQHLLGDLNQFGKEDIKVETASLVMGIKRKFEAEAGILSDAKMRSSALTDEKKIANLRKNIRDVMGENQLDTNTIVAQREESERLARVAEQQKIIREYQRQTAVNKQNVRTQNRVISLLQSGNTFAKITDLTDDGPLEIDTKSPVQLYNSNLDNNNQSHTSTILKKTNSELNETHKKINSNYVITDQPTFPVSEIVTIEDSSSEDDCILLSDEEDEHLEQEIEDDPSNSGLHVKDAYNVPDEQGRVVVNIGHHEGDSDIFVAPQIAKSIKPHQIGGVRFLFDNIIESIKRFNSSTGFGCILAHSMGLGKTMQVVCFCDIFLRHTDSKTVLCVMPINTLQNWVSEFNMWIPMESSDIQQVRPRSFKVFVLNDQQKTLNARGKVILKWAEEGGVLLMGYELFRLLALKLIPNRKRRIGKNCIVTEKVETEAHKRLSENIYQSLVKPGPDLVICDEGHRIKNSHAGISLALKQIRTRRRIVLTGYPLQNNLMEYWCMVDFVRPNYLGTRTEFSNMFERPIQNGQCIDSTPEDIKLMRFRAHVLHSLLVGFVQRRSHVVLQHTLPQKLEYVILTKMNDFQRKLYDTFMNDVVRKKTVPNPLKAFAVCCKIWNHPDVLYNFLKKRETDLDLEIDDGDGSPDSTTSLKDNINKNDNSMCSKDLLRKAESTILVRDPDASKLNSESKVQSIDLKTPHHVSSKSHFLYKESDHGSKTECKSKENKIANARFNSENFSQNYYTSSQSESFLPECNGETYWHDSNTPYYGYQSLCDNIGHPLKPDYVGIVIKQTRETENTNSSQIVDLDTKEIKIVETDIDVTINQLVNNISSSETETLKHMRSKYENMCEKSLTNSSKITSIKTMSSNSSTIKTFGNSGSFEKDSLKGKGEDVIPYDWAVDIMKGYEPNLIQNSPKMEIFFCILNESIKQGDRVLLFSQSLLTLNLIETFLQSTPVPDSNNCWAKNSSYYRLDGSTTSQEREKLVNDFNSNSSIMLFLISTKAGSLGINLVGANRVIVFDASWNPCHDTQAVYRIYRYGQQKPCFVYRIVMDKCLEKKIYDRQVKKQGMSDRVVDECNPDAHLSMKDVTNLCYDYDTDLSKSLAEFQKPIESYNDIIIQKIIETKKDALSKEPFHHESLLIDRKEKKLSLAEKRQAQRGYELEKKASSKQIFSCQANKLQYRIVRNDGTIVTRPVASVRPMQTIKAQNTFKSGAIRSTRWIPAEVWQRQGMTAQEMTLPLDVVIPTNSSDKTNIILKSGQRVMVLKSPKGIYMQLESGKIIAIRTSSKINPSSKSQKESIIDITTDSSTTTKQSSVVTKDHTEFKSMEKSTTNTYTVKENTNTKTTGLKAGSDVVIINEEKISKTITSLNKPNFQKHMKSSATQKKNKFSGDFAVNRMYPKGTEVISSVCKGNSLISSMNNTANTVNNENHFQNSTSSSKIYITEGIKEDDNIQCISREFPAPGEMTITKESFPEQTTNSQTSKPTYASSAFDSRGISPTVTEKPAYTCNIRQGKFNPEFDLVTGPQPSSTVQISPQIHKMQKSPHLSPILQQRPHDQRETFASVYNTHHSHYVDKVQQDVASRTATNALLTNLESNHHPQYYDTMYENGVVPSYEYPAHRYSNYNSHNTYVNHETHYHPHFHNFNNTQTNAISTHPYYMHWPPPMSTVAQSNNQHNLSPPYSQNGSSTNQWHNQR